MQYYLFVDTSKHVPNNWAGGGWYPASLPVEIWELDGQTGRRIDVVDGSGFSHVKLNPGELFLEGLRRHYPARFCEWEAAARRPVGHEQRPPWELHALKLAPGEYYPRMARPWCTAPYDSPGTCGDFEGYKNEIASLTGQLAALVRRLQGICEIIHPCEENFCAYGHEIRNLLILACTEVETHWRAVLEANGALSKTSGSKQPILTTNNYVKLADPLKLREYQASFPNYPWVVPVSPFAAWDLSKATQSLSWYNAYNSTIA